MRTESILTALKVAETGHYTTAARGLYIDLNTAYQRIYQLEQELGFKLFDRVNGGRARVVVTRRGDGG